jgi:hypothetical protein
MDAALTVVDMVTGSVTVITLKIYCSGVVGFTKPEINQRPALEPVNYEHLL